MHNPKEYKQIEYQELCAYHRHQRELTWQMGSILITASLAVFGIVASRFDILPLAALILSGIVSIFTLVLFWLIFERMSFLNDVAKARMKEIEREFDMYIARAVELGSEYRSKTNHPIGRFARMRFLIRSLVGIYTFCWVSLWIYKWSMQC